MRLLKKTPAAFSPFFRAHVLEVRGAGKTGCGLAGQTFLNRPDASGLQRTYGPTGAWKSLFFNTTPNGLEEPPQGVNCSQETNVRTSSLGVIPDNNR